MQKALIFATQTVLFWFNLWLTSSSHICPYSPNCYGGCRAGRRESACYKSFSVITGLIIINFGRGSHAFAIISKLSGLVSIFFSIQSFWIGFSAVFYVIFIRIVIATISFIYQCSNRFSFKTFKKLNKFVDVCNIYVKFVCL